MSGDADKQDMQAREILLDSVPSAARIVLGRFIGWSPDEVAEDPARALKAGMNMLRATKGGPSAWDEAVVRALKWLLNDVPENHADRGELEAAIGWLGKRE